MVKQPKRKATPRKVTSHDAKSQLITKKVSAPTVRKRKSSKTQKRKRSQKQKGLRLSHIIVCFKVVGICFLFLLATAIALSFTSLFKIEAIEVEASAHVSQEDAISLAQVPEDANLLNINPFALTAQLKKNPWVESIDVERVFPHTLKLVIHEKIVEALIPMSNTQTVWALSPDKTWIQPVDVSSQNADSLLDAALKIAIEQGCFVVANITDELNPKPGETCDNERINLSYQINSTLTDDLSSQVVQYDIPNTEAITLMLKSGVEIAIGSTSQLDTKEAVVMQLLSSYENQITYINVRNPAKPAYKKVNVDDLQPGSGIEGL